MGLAAAAAGLQALALAWPLALLLAAGLFAAGLWGLLRFDPLGRLVRDRYTSRLRRAA